jgi:hypothetical protein
LLIKKIDKMKYLYVREGAVFNAASPLRVVEWFRDGSRFCADETIEQYIKGFSGREKLYSGVDLRIDSIDNFVKDLVKCKILTLLEEGKK